ncbi:MAG: hypothetical protein JNN05_08550 [Candidatus Omnitrophica bacterium]|nr:hypothetical protein [Candidatus Omnitrophota bacterium]
MKNNLLFTALLICCVGCTTIWVKAPEIEYKHSGLKIRAMLPSKWMRYTPDKGLILTKDGTTLDIISVSRIRFKDKLEFTKRQFTEDMSVLDLAEVEIDNFKSDTNRTQWTILQNKPAMVRSVDAYFFEYTCESLSGLKIHGQQYGFIFNNFVYRIRFEAADQFYYGKTVDDFLQFVKSINLEPTKD